MRLLPMWAWGLIVAAMLAVSSGAGWFARGVIADRDIAALQTEHALAVAFAARQAQAAEAAAREEEARRTAEVERIAREERKAQQARAAAAARARAAADSLRGAAQSAVDAIASEAASGAAAPERGAAVTGAGLVFADVLGSCGQRVAELAAWLDDARARGSACERAYESQRKVNHED